VKCDEGKPIVSAKACDYILKAVYRAVILERCLGNEQRLLTACIVPAVRHLWNRVRRLRLWSRCIEANQLQAVSTEATSHKVVDLGESFTKPEKSCTKPPELHCKTPSPPNSNQRSFQEQSGVPLLRRLLPSDC
jgi:hypothetical protein